MLLFCCLNFFMIGVVWDMIGWWEDMIGLRGGYDWCVVKYDRFTGYMLGLWEDMIVLP